MAEPAGAVVLDASVVVKWFRQEESLGNLAVALRDAYTSGALRIAVPTLLANEVANVLCCQQDRTTSQVQEELESLFSMELVWRAPAPMLMCRAVELARRYGITAYDATYLAVSEVELAPFVTADERLLRKLTGFPLVRFLGDCDWLG